MTNVTVDYTNVLTATDPLGVGLVLSEFNGVPLVTSPTWNALLTNLAPGHMRASLAWLGGSPGYGAGGSGYTRGTAAALVKAIKGTGAIPLISFNGDTNDNNFQPADGGRLVSFFNSGGGQNNGPVKYWSIGNEPEFSGGTWNTNTYKAGSGQGSASATLAAMLAADPSINVGVPAAGDWDTGLLTWAAGLTNIGCLSYHAYDALDAPGSDNGHGGFFDTGEYFIQTGTMRGMKSGVLYGVEEFNVNSNPSSGATVAFATSWKNTVWIADVLGQLLSSGAHGTVYSDINDPGLSIISGGTNGSPFPYGTPMPAYWGLGVWTGMNGQFKRYSNNMVSATTTYTNTSVSVYACDNGKIIAINKDTASHPLNIALTIPGGATTGTYNVWASSGTGSPTAAITEVVTNAAFSGAAINYTIPAQTAISIDVAAVGLTGNPASGGGGGGGATGTFTTSSPGFSMVQTGVGFIGVHLSAAPTGNVTVTTSRTAGNTGLSLTAGASLTFTPANWNASQNLQFSADATSTGAATFTVTAPGYTPYVITITETAPAGGGGGGGGAAATASNDFESSSNGTAITTGNSGGVGRNAWNAVSTTNAATAVYSTTQAANGSFSGAFTTSGVAGVSYVSWTSATVGSQPVIYGRAYVYLTANPTSDTNIADFWNGATFGGGVMIASSGQLRLQNAAFGEIGGGPTMPLNQWFRLEWQVNAGAAGAASATVNYYNSPTSTAISGTVTDTGGQYGSGGVINETHYGYCSSHVSQPLMYLDNVAISTTGFLGPVSSGGAGAGSMQVSATQVSSNGGNKNGIGLSVRVLTGAKAVNAQTGGAVASGNTTVINASMTPSAAGSQIYYGIMSTGSATAVTLEPAMTSILNTTDATNVDAIAFAKLTALTPNTTAILVGAATAAGTNDHFAAAEILGLTSSSLTEDASTPAAVYTSTATTITSPSFTPPAGALLVMIVVSDQSGAGTQFIHTGDTLGLTWTQLVTNPGSFPNTGVWIAQVPSVVAVTNPGSQTGTVGTALSLSITSTGSSLTYSASGLPGGLSISSSTGVITGTPTTAGTYSATVTATDINSNSDSATFTWTISNAAGSSSAGTIPPIKVTATAGGNASAGILLRVLALDNAIAPTAKNPNGASQSGTAAHSAAITPLTTGSWALAAEVNFPAVAAAPVAATANTVIDAVSDTVSNALQAYGYGTFRSTATLTSGTPFTAGSTDAAAGGVAVLEVQPNGTIAIDASSPAAVSSVSLSAGVSSVSSATFLPPNGSLLVALVCASGNPYSAASMTVSDSYGLVWTEAVNATQPGNGYAGIWVASVPAALAINTASVPAGTTGYGYAAALAATGGFAPYTWSLATGSLPAGVSLNTSTGVISGTPTGSGTSTFTVTVTDSSGATNTSGVLSIPISAIIAAGVQLAGSWIGNGGAYTYGTLQMNVNNAEHDWLFVAASWQSGQDEAMAFISDDAHNTYRPLFYTPGNNVHTQVWAVPNARAANYVYVSTSAFVRYLTVQVMDFSGMSPGWLVDVITDTTAGGVSSAFTMNMTGTGPDFVFGVGAFAGTPEGVALSGTVTGGSAGWNFVPGQGNGSQPYGVSQAAAWATSNSAPASTLTVSGASVRPFSGGMASVFLGRGPNANAANLAWPNISVQAAFGYTPGNPTSLPNWTDITSRFLGFEGPRGRNFELDELTAADVTINLDNFDGALTPFNTGGYPVDLVTQVRVYADWQGRRYTLGSGLITALPQTFDFQRGIIKAKMSDDYSKLPQILLPSCMIAEMLYDNPLNLWPLNDASNALQASNWSGRSTAILVPVAGKYGGGLTGTTPTTGFGNSLNANGWTAGLNGTTDTVWGNSASLVSGTYVKGTALVNGSDDNLPWTSTGATYEFWAGLNPNAGGGLGTYGATLMTLGDDKGANGGGNFLTLSMLSTPFGSTLPTFIAFAGGQGWGASHFIPIPIANSTNNPWLTLWHHYAVTISTAGQVGVYMDGNLLSSFKGNFPSGVPTRLSFGGDPKQPPTFMTNTNSWASVTPAGFFTGNLANCAVYDRVLDPERIAAHFQSGSTGFVAEKSGPRIQRFLTYARWAGPQAIEKGSSRQQQLNYLGGGYASSGLSGAIGQFGTTGGGFSDQGAQVDISVQDVAAGELGLLFVASDGTLTFRQRDEQFNRPVVWNIGDMDTAINNTRDYLNWPGNGGSNCTPTVSSTWTYQGGSCALLTVTGSPTQAYPFTAHTAMTPGELAGGSAWVMSPAGCFANIVMDYFTAGGTYISSYGGTPTWCPPLTPVFLQFPPGAAPATSSYVQFHPTIALSPAAGTQLYVDRLRLSPTGFEVAYEDDLEITTDIGFLYNDIAVTRNVDQANFRVKDTASRNKYYPRVFTRTIFADTSDAQAVVDLANWLLNDYVQPRQRVSKLTVDAATNPDYWPFVLGADIGDLVSFQRNPVGANGIAGVHMILSIDTNFSPDTGTFSYVLAPVTDLGVLTLDDPVYGLIGANELGW